MYDASTFFIFGARSYERESRAFSIGEIANALGVTRRIILNYEARGLIQPDVKDAAGGNRYYTVDTFTLIRSIRSFQTLGLSLDEIRDYFHDTADLNALIHRLEELRDMLTLNIEKLYERAESTSGKVQMLRLEPQRIYRRTFPCSGVEERKALLRSAALEALRAYGTDITQRLYFTEYDIDRPNVVDFCVAVPDESEGENILTLPGFQGICIYHHGAYEMLPQVAKRLLAFAAKTGLTPTGRLRHTYLEGPPQHKDPSKFITQVILPLK